MENEKTPKEDGLQLRLLWAPSEDIPVLYSNQLFVSHSGETEFHLIFGHLAPPILHGLTEDEMPSEIYIDPIAKIVVSYEVMKKIVKVMNANLEKFEGNKNDNSK